MFLGITFKTSLENRCTIFFDHKRAIVSHVKKNVRLLLSEQMAHLLAFIGCIFPLLKHRGISHLQVGWAKIVKILYRIFFYLFVYADKGSKGS